MNHPYVEFEKTPLWKTLHKAISDLQENRDVELTTAEQYVVGYLCKQLVKRKFVVETAIKKKLIVKRSK